MWVLTKLYAAIMSGLNKIMDDICVHVWKKWTLMIPKLVLTILFLQYTLSRLSLNRVFVIHRFGDILTKMLQFMLNTGNQSYKGPLLNYVCFRMILWKIYWVISLLILLHSSISNVLSHDGRDCWFEWTRQSRCSNWIEFRDFGYIHIFTSVSHTKNVTTIYQPSLPSSGYIWLLFLQNANP